MTCDNSRNSGSILTKKDFPPWEADCRSGSQRIPRILLKPKVQCRLYKSTQKVECIAKGITPVFEVHFKIPLSSTPRSSKLSLSFRILNQNFFRGPLDLCIHFKERGDRFFRLAAQKDHARWLPFATQVLRLRIWGHGCGPAWVIGVGTLFSHYCSICFSVTAKCTQDLKYEEGRVIALCFAVCLTSEGRGRCVRHLL